MKGEARPGKVDKGKPMPFLILSIVWFQGDCRVNKWYSELL